jgi:alanine dehydrogenase
VPTAVGIPKEIKDQEGRVSMQPDAVVELVHHRHEVNVQPGVSKGSGFSDEEYESAGGARGRERRRGLRGCRPDR